MNGMANVEALKAIYAALGGDADDVAGLTLIADVLNAIATQLSAGGGQLPAVDASSNGKVLKVADGKWSIGTDAT